VLVETQFLENVPYREKRGRLKAEKMKGWDRFIFRCKDAAGVIDEQGMPRMARVVLPHFPHHVVQREHNWQVVFAGDEDCERYLEDLRGLSSGPDLRVRKYICPRFLVYHKGADVQQRWVNSTRGSLVV